MTDLFRGERVPEGVHFIRKLCEQYERTTKRQVDTGLFLLLYLLLRSPFASQEPTWQRLIQYFFFTDTRHVLIGAVVVKVGVPLFEWMRKETDDEEVLRLVEEAREELFAGSREKEDHRRDLAFLKWDAFRTRNWDERLCYLMQIRYGVAYLLADHFLILEKPKEVVNLFSVFRLPPTTIAYYAFCLQTEEQDDPGERERIDACIERLEVMGGLVRHRDYGLFLLRLYLDLHDGPIDDDMLDALCYLMELVGELLDEEGAPSGKREFPDLIMKLWEDLTFDPRYYGRLAMPLLDWITKELPYYYDGWFDDLQERTPQKDPDFLASQGLAWRIAAGLHRVPAMEPSRIYAYLDRFIVGQRAAKRTLATALYGHLKRIRHRTEKFIPDAVLLVGPSGCGKTELVRRLMEVIDLPCALVDVTAMSDGQHSAGLHREDLLQTLYRKAGGDLEKAQSGVIFMDEFDKLLVPSITSTGRNYHGDVQSQLLTMIEGSKLEIPSASGPILFDTSRVLFILAGAFEGIEDDIRSSRRESLRADTAIGFDAVLDGEVDDRVAAGSVTHDVLMRFGMKRELAGRIGSIAVVEPLTREQLRQVLTETRDNVSEGFARELCCYCGGSLRLSEEVLTRAVDMAMAYQLGARGLSIALRKLLLPAFYEAPNHRGVSELRIGMEDNGRVTAVWAGKRKETDQPAAGETSEAGAISDDLRASVDDFLARYTPSSINRALDAGVVGQEEAKRLLSLAIYNHCQRIAHPASGIRKFNVLLVGPSGSGKTELVRRISELVALPVILADVSGIVATPYKGQNKETLLMRLYRQAERKLGDAEAGIIFCDEFDKLCRRNGAEGYDYNDQLMGQFLGMMEGSVIDTAQRSGKGDEESIVIDTRNILFVCMGTFAGLEEIVLRDRRERLAAGRSGFGLAAARASGERMRSADVELRHLVDYGMKPELAGRLCNLAVLDDVDREVMLKILTETEDSPLRRLQRELMLDDHIRLEIDDDALPLIVDRAIDRGIGARALNTVLREILEDVLFDAPSLPQGSTVYITREMLEN